MFCKCYTFHIRITAPATTAIQSLNDPLINKYQYPGAKGGGCLYSWGSPPLVRFTPGQVWENGLLLKVCSSVISWYSFSVLSLCSVPSTFTSAFMNSCDMPLFFWNFFFKFFRLETTDGFPSSFLWVLDGCSVVVCVRRLSGAETVLIQAWFCFKGGRELRTGSSGGRMFLFIGTGWGSYDQQKRIESFFLRKIIPRLWQFISVNCSSIDNIQHNLQRTNYRAWMRRAFIWTLFLQTRVKSALWRDVRGLQVVWTMRKCGWDVFLWFWGVEAGMWRVVLLLQICVGVWVFLWKQQLCIVSLVIWALT